MTRSASMSACQRIAASQRLRTAAMSGLIAAASASVSCSYRGGMPAAWVAAATSFALIRGRDFVASSPGRQ